MQYDYPSPERSNYDPYYAPYDQQQYNNSDFYDHQQQQEVDDDEYYGQQRQYGQQPPMPSYSQQPDRLLDSDFDRSVSIRSPSYADQSHVHMAHIEAQRAHMANLPHVDLPPYELPPPYIPRSERRVHENYRSNVETFRNRVIELNRNKPSDPLGFSIRGGVEYKCGVFISKVHNRSNAHRAGLREGDQILFANDDSFLHIESHEAMKCLKKHKDVKMMVKYFPYAYEKSYDKCKSTPLQGY